MHIISKLYSVNHSQIIYNVECQPPTLKGSNAATKWKKLVYTLQDTICEYM